MCKAGEADERQKPYEQKQSEEKPAAQRIEGKINQKCAFSFSGMALSSHQPCVKVKMPDKAKHRNHLIFCVDAQYTGS